MDRSSRPKTLEEFLAQYDEDTLIEVVQVLDELLPEFCRKLNEEISGSHRWN